MDPVKARERVHMEYRVGVGAPEGILLRVSRVAWHQCRQVNPVHVSQCRVMMVIMMMMMMMMYRI
jgi:hypothetical protein